MANLMASLIFGCIGLVAFFYGKKRASWIPMTVGIALMAYPYFISDTLLLYMIGGVLTICLYFFRE